MGRSLGDIVPSINYPDLVDDIQQVIEKVAYKEKEVNNSQGQWYKVRIMPYKTSKNVIDGATITFQDISHMKNIQKKIQSALHYAEDIINTVREPLLVLDRNLMVISANKSYYETFNLKKSLTEGEKLNDIGVGEWNIPSLQKILIDILEVNSEMNDFEFEHDFKDVGHKKMLLNARRIYRGDMDTEMILLAMEDVKV